MSTSSAPPRSALLGGAIVGVLAIVGALLFAAIYLVLPQNGHFYALVTIGILSLVFALASYLAQAVAPDPLMPRALAWGFAGLGYALLLGSVLLNPTSVLNFITQIVLLIVILLFVLVTLIGGYWRYRTVAVDQVRIARRDGWKASSPPSALDYQAAQHERDVAANPPIPAKGPP
jgi:thiol:disulfide interchange protein